MGILTLSFIRYVRHEPKMSPAFHLRASLMDGNSMMNLQ